MLPLAVECQSRRTRPRFKGEAKASTCVTNREKLVLEVVDVSFQIVNLCIPRCKQLLSRVSLNAAVLIAHARLISTGSVQRRDDPKLLQAGMNVPRHAGRR